MFTGLVTEVGTIDRVSDTDAGREFRVSCTWDDVTAGESIAVNGACLTARERGAGWFTVAAVQTTIARTAMRDWSPGRRVNLERALRAGDRLGGHFVLGHVDEVGIVADVEQSGDARLVDVELSAAMSPLLVPHGSITIDGVSLTVNAIREPSTVQVSLIDHTLRHTTLDALARGDRVHVEADVIGKYVQRLTSATLAGAELSGPGQL